MTANSPQTPSTGPANKLGKPKAADLFTTQTMQPKPMMHPFQPQPSGYVMNQPGSALQFKPAPFGEPTQMSMPQNNFVVP